VTRTCCSTVIHDQKQHKNISAKFDVFIANVYASYYSLQNPLAVKPDQQSSSNTASGDSKIYAAPSSGDYMPLHPSGRTLEINREQVKIIKVVGKGAFSQVAKATAWNIGDNEECTTVAVKMLKGAVRNFKLSKFVI